jgi:hypothetical protein
MATESDSAAFIVAEAGLDPVAAPLFRSILADGKIAIVVVGNQMFWQVPGLAAGMHIATEKADIRKWLLVAADAPPQPAPSRWSTGGFGGSRSSGPPPGKYLHGPPHPLDLIVRALRALVEIQRHGGLPTSPKPIEDWTGGTRPGGGGYFGSSGGPLPGIGVATLVNDDFVGRLSLQYVQGRLLPPTSVTWSATDVLFV